MIRAVVPAVLVLGVACGDAPVVTLVVDTPTVTRADPMVSTDELELSVARAGDPDDLSLTRGQPGQPLELHELDYGDDLVVHLRGFDRGLGIAYGRTCPFPVQPELPDPQSHLYFSRTVRWGDTAEPAGPLRGTTASAALPDGSGLLVGGDGGAHRAERFAPQDGVFTAVAGQLAPRTGGVLLGFADGRAVLVGGSHEGDAVRTLELLDPLRSDRVEVESGLPLVEHAGTVLTDDAAIVAGGRFQSSAGAPFTVSASAWRLRFPDGGALEAPRRLPDLVRARAGHTMTLLGDVTAAGVLVAGGRDEAGAPVAEVELYRPLRERFELVEGAALARWEHRAVELPGGFVVIVGGYAPDPLGGPPIPSPELALYDPFDGTFAIAGELPAGAGLLEVSATRLPDGRVLVAGGRDAVGAPVSSAYIIQVDPVNGELVVSVTDPMLAPRAGHAALLLCDGTVLVAGGVDDPNALAVERYNPPPTGRR